MSRPERFAVVTPPRLVDDQRIKPVAFIGGDGLAIVAGATSLPDDVARAQIALAWFLEPENWLLRANAIGHLPADHELMKRTRFWPMVSSILQSGRYATYPALPIWATDMEASLVDADFRSLWVEIASGGPANEGVIRDRLEAMDAKVEHAVTREQWATFGLNALRVGLVPALFSLAILLLVIALQRYRIALLREQLRRRDVLAEYIEVLDSMAALPATEAEPLEELEGLLRPELANGPAEEVEEVEGMGRASRERYRRWRELRQKGGHYGSPD
jgi:hypothetical protein